MISVLVPRTGGAPAWRAAARQCLALELAPHDIRWDDGTSERLLLDAPALAEAAGQGDSRITVPKAFLLQCESALCHQAAERHDLLYRLLWRLRGEPRLMENDSDPDVASLRDMVKSVSRDCHKMKAFVRFREIAIESGRRQFMAWFEPQHHIVERTAPFFARRFADMDWAILTPKGTVRFTGGQLAFGPAAERPQIAEDATEDLWKTYFTNIFNPSRLKVKAMQAEMPKKYWKNMPEAALIPDLIATAARRSEEMRQRAPSAVAAHVARIKAKTVSHPAFDGAIHTSHAALAAAERACQRCPLHAQATQTVCGSGKPQASIMLVGEQPGDMEDLKGEAFVGPAGSVLRQAVAAAGLMWDDLFVTNAVKHFKYTMRGKRRLHARPSTSEIDVCKWWLGQEIALVQPRIIIAAGGTALHALTGNSAGVATRRGSIEQLPNGLAVMPTFHPSAILRQPEAEMAAQMRRALAEDIAAAASYVSAAATVSAVSERS